MISLIIEFGHISLIYSQYFSISNCPFVGTYFKSQLELSPSTVTCYPLDGSDYLLLFILIFSTNIFLTFTFLVKLTKPLKFFIGSDLNSKFLLELFFRLCYSFRPFHQSMQ